MAAGSTGIMGGDSLIIGVFVATYLGMALGRVPGLRLDRAGMALVGLVILLVSGAVGLPDIGVATDLGTLMLLFALMILSAQFAAAGFYDWCADRVARADVSPRRLLALVILVSGVLSAVLVNDIVVFSMTPLLVAGLTARGLDPRPYLLALAAASNAGSAGTLIGNPQNILIGQVGGLDFWQFSAVCAVPAALSLAVVHYGISYFWRHNFFTLVAQGTRMAETRLDSWQAGKAAAGVILLFLLFLGPWPREISALLVAGLLMLSRRLPSRAFLGAVDWPLLLLFTCLFTITAAFAGLGYGDRLMGWLSDQGLMPDRLASMAPLALVLSNTVGNVPGVMLVLNAWPDAGPGALTGLALLSTLAGNFLITGSLANLIVAERAALSGVRLGFRDFARAGMPITLVTLGLATLWLWLLGLMPF